MECAVEIHRHQLSPEFFIGFEKWSGSGLAGVVNKDVNGAETVAGGDEGAGDSVGIRDICDHGIDDVLNDVSHRPDSTTEHGDAGAVMQKAKRDRDPDAAHAAGDDGVFAGELLGADGVRAQTCSLSNAARARLRSSCVLPCRY